MIYKHELKAYLKTFLIWTLTIAGTDFGFMLLYPSLKDSMNEAMSAFENMGSFAAAFGMDRLNSATALGFYGVYIGVVLSLGGALFSAMVGAGILSKEEGGHTSEFLYTLPYTRVHICIQKAAAIATIILAFDLVNLLLGLLCFPIIQEEPSLKELFLYHTAQYFMHLEIAAIGVFLSAFTKKINLGGGLGIALLFYFLDIMSRVLKQLEFSKYITPFYYSNASDVIVNKKIDSSLLGIGLLITLLCVIAGIWHYNRRDLAS